MSSIKRAIYAGTFDLFTNGHEAILRRSLKIFDEVTIVVAVSPSKKTLFSREERVEMLSALFSNEPKIKVDSWQGLIVDYAKQKKIHTIIRGLRPTGDFENEFQMAAMNKNLFPDVETVLLMTGEDTYFVSSSLVKEVMLHGGDISKYVSPVVLNYLKRLKK